NPTVTLSRPEDPIEKIITTDGRLVHHKEVEIRDPLTKEVVPIGTDGELWTRGPSLFLGYHKRPDLTKESMDEYGWFYTGDRGRLDPEGYLTITGRTKDIIIRGGENFPVKETEDLLGTHPSIAEVAIVAMPDPRLQEKACAFVSLRPGAKFEFEDMIHFLETQGIAKRRYPEHLEVLPNLPKTPSGKIKKRVLRQYIAEKVGLPPVESGA
ncbi:MAG: AMP-binding protein, partial [Desulfobacterales bacterium]